VNRILRHAPRHGTRGASLLLVLILLAVMLLGGLAFSRMGATGILLSGNTAQKEAALRASEAGLNAAFARLNTAGFDPSATAAAGYSPSRLSQDAQGMPDGIDWSAADTANGISVNEFRVAHYIERMCATAAPTDMAASCLVLGEQELGSARAGAANPAPRIATTYRVTVRVLDTRGTTTFTQTLMSLGS
jgi:Tfp pilus assembly protein PilX